MEELKKELLEASAVKDYSPPWIEMLSGAGHGLLPAPGRRFDWEGRLEELSQAGGRSGAIADDLIALNRRLGVREELVVKAGRVFAGEGGVVVAGQQPGLFGGPLFTLYKAMTCIELACGLEERFGVPVLPVFWNAGDDDDFDEVRSGTFVTRGGGLLRVEAPAVEGDGRPCVGGIAAARLRPLLEAVRDLIESWGGGGIVEPILEEAVGGETWGEHFSRILARTFDGRILVYDSLSPVWRGEAAALVERYVELREDVLDELAARGERMRSAGLEPPVGAGTLEIPLTLMENGVRRKFPSWDGGRIMEILEDDPSALCPNVTLRAPFQDALFPVLASVVGPGELGYLSQLSPLYSGLGISEPLRVPRLTCTILPETAIRVAGALGVAPSRIFTDWEGSRRDYIRSMMPEGFCGAVEELAMQFEAEGRRAASLVDDGGRLGREVERIRRMIDAMKSKGEQALARKSKEKGLDLPLLAEYIRPRGVLQERVLTFFLPILSGGAPFAEHLEALAREHIRNLERGASGHYVVEPP